MGRPPEQAHCRKCGVPCARRGRWDGGWQCIMCAIATHAEATRQIHAGEGEYYEKWLDGMAHAIEKRRAKARAARHQVDSAPPGKS